jgi:Heterokaryon incompatibility protein (HET)
MWLQRCQAQHQSCHVAAATFLPTRLIDVGVKTPPAPSLCFGENLTSRARYTTLSHCWGESISMPVTLKTSNIQSMMHSLDFRSLPKTFQEAILVTQKLGIRYIWVDSLCIIQDCQKDWEKESVSTFSQTTIFLSVPNRLMRYTLLKILWSIPSSLSLLTPTPSFTKSR